MTKNAKLNKVNEIIIDRNVYYIFKIYYFN